MKFIFTLFVSIVFALVGRGQSITANGTVAANTLTTGNAWTISTIAGPPQTFTATAQVNGNQFARRLNITGFHFSSLPSNAIITGFTITVVRYATQADMVTDFGVFLVTNNTATGNSIAPGTPAGDWPTAPGSAVTYTATNASYNLTPANLNANFGVQILANRTGGSGGGTDINVTGATITVQYNLRAPIILTSFDISKTADNHVSIQFATASEENVKNIFIERSSDGRNFSPIFTITPVGARNKYTRYALTDKTPLQGTNYYRIKEIDLDGNLSYFDIKAITINRGGTRFQAFYSGADIKVNLSGIKGDYVLSLHDAGGAQVSSQTLKIMSNSFQTSLPAPQRAGVYIVTLKGEGISETARIFVGK
jgi:hypothetical protein